MAVKRSKEIKKRNFIGIPGQDGSYFAFLVSKLVAGYVESQVVGSWCPNVVLIENAVNKKCADFNDNFIRFINKSNDKCH